MDEKYTLTAAEEKALKTFLNRRLGADLEWITTTEGSVTTMKTSPLSTSQQGILSHIFAAVQYDISYIPHEEAPDKLVFLGEIRAHWKDWQGGMNGLGTEVYVTLTRKDDERFRIVERMESHVIWEDE